MIATRHIGPAHPDGAEGSLYECADCRGGFDRNPTLELAVAVQDLTKALREFVTAEVEGEERRRAFLDAYRYFKAHGSVDVLSELYYASLGHELGSIHVAVNEND